VKYVAIILPALWCSYAFSADVNTPMRTTSLTVQVVNGTANGASVEDDKVFLQIYQHEQLQRTFDGAADKEGKAAFKEIPCGDHIVGVVGAMHRGMSFGGNTVALEHDTNDVYARVQVYDTSDDQTKLFVSAHHISLKIQQDSLLVTEYVQLENASDMAITAKDKDRKGRPIVVRMVLPKGIKNINFASYFEPQAVEMTDDGFYDTMAVPPGKNAITFSYTLDIQSASLNFVRKVMLPTSNVAVFTELNTAKIEGLDAPGTAVSREGMPMEFFTLNNLAPGAKIAFRITGLNKAAPESATWMILAGVFVVIAIIAGVKLYSGKASPKSST
jgi:hypothetical protein